MFGQALNEYLPHHRRPGSNEHLPLHVWHIREQELQDALPFLLSVHFEKVSFYEKGVYPARNQHNVYQNK